MYSDKVRHWGRRIGIGLLILALIALGAVLFSRGSRKELLTESATAIEQTIKKSALQCYVIEGVYPPDLTYLTDNYGLQVNEKDFIIHYEAFSSNLPPEVRVLIREDGEEITS